MFPTIEKTESASVTSCRNCGCGNDSASDRRLAALGLTLTVTRACNLRCSYCYMRRSCLAEPQPPMHEDIARQAISRAAASLAPGGRLTLGFFGGEPLLEAERISRWIEYARHRCRESGLLLRLGLTTNGTIASPAAWRLMLRHDLDLAVSCDGLPQVHDRHRRALDGRGTAELVCHTIRLLLDNGRSPTVVMVVRPDTLDELPAGLRFLRALGVRRIEPSLDLWTAWAGGDLDRLDAVVAACADVWRAGLPEVSVSWFDGMAARLLGAAGSCAERCGFGRGEIAVDATGRLHRCERLIGEGAAAHELSPGHVFDGADFLGVAPAPARSCAACAQCAIAEYCTTFCRCSNYVRTGDAQRPDALLCRWNRACFRETARALRLGRAARRARPATNSGEAGSWKSRETKQGKSRRTPAARANRSRFAASASGSVRS